MDAFARDGNATGAETPTGPFAGLRERSRRTSVRTSDYGSGNAPCTPVMSVVGSTLGLLMRSMSGSGMHTVWP